MIIDGPHLIKRWVPMKRGSTRENELFRNNDVTSCDSIIPFFVSHKNSLGYTTCPLNYNVIQSFSALNVIDDMARM